MSTLLQQILKYNPHLDTMNDLGMKLTDTQATIVEEIERRRAEDGYPTFDKEQDRILELVERVGGWKLREEVDSLIGSCMGLYSDSAFALGYHTAKHPEWAIFENEIDVAILERIRRPL